MAYFNNKSFIPQTAKKPKRKAVMTENTRIAQLTCLRSYFLERRIIFSACSAEPFPQAGKSVSPVYNGNSFTDHRIGEAEFKVTDQYAEVADDP